MKIFISHSSKNKFYGEVLVQLLRDIGVKENEIIFTSNTAYGIPVGQNIFNWLKSQITESPIVIYLLSEEYYKSIACLNEMGAAWIIENKHAAIFTPNFDLSSKEFQSGALDPREIGFFINDKERILSFISMISEDFEISNNYNIINQSLEKFITEVNNIKNQSVSKVTNTNNYSEQNPNIQEINEKIIESEITSNKSDLFLKFIDLITSRKLKDDELLLLQYIIETGRYKLMTGWQESKEIEFIKDWESINNLVDTLSRNYISTLNKFELRGFTSIEDYTYNLKPKLVKINDEIANNLLDLPQRVLNIISIAVSHNQKF